MNNKVCKIPDWFTNPESNAQSLNMHNFHIKKQPCRKSVLERFCKRCDLYRPGINSEGLCPSCIEFNVNDGEAHSEKLTNNDQPRNKSEDTHNEEQKLHLKKTPKRNSRKTQKEKKQLAAINEKRKDTGSRKPRLSENRHLILEAIKNGKLDIRQVRAVIVNSNLYGFSEEELESLVSYKDSIATPPLSSGLIVYSGSDWWSRER